MANEDAHDVSEIAGMSFKQITDYRLLKTIQQSTEVNVRKVDYVAGKLTADCQCHINAARVSRADLMSVGIAGNAEVGIATE